MTHAEHDYIVEIPEGLEFEHITDFVRGWFRAEVQIIICKGCGNREIGWRPARLENPNSAADLRAVGWSRDYIERHKDELRSENPDSAKGGDK